MTAPAAGEPGLVAEIRPGIHRITQRLGPRDLHLYLVMGERPLLVDTGLASTPEQVILPALRRLGVPPARLGSILITHPDVDHFGGNAAMKRAAPQAKLLAHAADRRWIESREAILAERYGWYAAHGLDYAPETKAWIGDNLGPDVPLDATVGGGEWLDLGGRRVRVLHLPGHAAGHLGVWEPESGTAIVGDAVLERGLYDVAGTLLSPPPYFAVRPYLDSIARLRHLRPAHLLTAHYPALSGEAVEHFLSRSRGFVLDLARSVADTLRGAGSPLTLKAITAAADRAVGPFASFANELAGPVRAHLEDLVAAGEAGTTVETSETGGEGVPAWAWLGRRG
jgi:glyoxylase-like metal-dependent hydrolase (beta-lactamase superfamily II)